jgi:MFS family permease
MLYRLKREEWEKSLLAHVTSQSPPQNRCVPLFAGLRSSSNKPSSTRTTPPKERNHSHSMNSNYFFWLKFCLFLDFFSVAIIIPLLPTYFRYAGVTTEMNGYIMSLYHLSQIIGGLVMGALSDYFPKKNILILSFFGSALSYGLVGVTSNLSMLFFSRILVGLVKQTMTITTSIISSHCQGGTSTSSSGGSNQRAELLSQLNGARSLGFIIGPSVGSVLYQLDSHYPPLVASMIFGVNIMICVLMIPSEPPSPPLPSSHSSSSSSSTLSNNNTGKPPTGSSSPLRSLQNLFSFLSQNHLFFPLFCPCLLLFLDSITTPAAIPSYLELQYATSTSSLGYIFSFASLIAFLCHSFMMKPFLSLTASLSSSSFFTSTSSPAHSSAAHASALTHTSSTIHTILFSLLLTLLANLCEICLPSTLLQYLLLYLPLTTLSTSIHHPLAKSHLLHATSPSMSGTLLGIFGLMENGISVLAPIYAGILYGRLGYQWRGVLALVHYGIGFMVLWAILLVQERQHGGRNGGGEDEVFKKKIEKEEVKEDRVDRLSDSKGGGAEGERLDVASKAKVD